MIKRIILATIIAIFSFFLLAGYFKGDKGNPLYFQTQHDTRLGGPFEASNSTGRYALTESVVNNGSLFLSLPLAKFSSPDVVEYKGKFISIFTPGISFLGIPFYIIGKYFGIPQIATYLLTLIAAIINVFLIALLAKKLQAGWITGVISGLIFLFATNGLAYSLTFTQHHVSTMIVLLALLCATGANTLKKNLFFGALFGIGILVDIPNAFFLAPIGIYLPLRALDIHNATEKITISFKPLLFGILIGVVPFIILFGWYNHTTTGSFTKLGQAIGRSHAFKSTQPQLQVDNNASTIRDEGSKPIGLHLPFATRAELQGMYILLLSNERSWLYYSPVLLLGIFGFVLAYKNNATRTLSSLAMSVVLIDIVSYSMFGDPWGGWAFGPRYLIPAAALMSLFIAPLIIKYKANLIFIVIFLLTLTYSIMVNALGALTTAAIPPKIEAASLPSKIPYTYIYNQQLLAKNFSGSLIYNIFLSTSIHEITYYEILVGSTLALFVVLYIVMLFVERKK